MDLSPIGRAGLEAREGERLTAYKDSQGVWTISIGVTTASGLIVVKPGMTITKEQSDALFTLAVQKYVATVRASLKVPVPQEFFDACCSLCYNIGQPGFQRSSIVRLANAGNLPAAIEAFLLWDKPAAIISRRQGEHDQAGTPYSKSLPYARRGDKAPIKAPPGTVVAITKPPDPVLPVAPEKQPTLPLTKPPSAPLKPAPSGGLSSAPTSAPLGPVVQTGGFWAALKSLFTKKDA